jgi:hypothetical protein
MPAQDPVAVAEKLVKLVKSISEAQVDSLKIWNTKVEIQNACDSLLAKVLGPLEHTVLIAGTSTAIYLLSPIIISLCQQSLAMSRQLLTLSPALESPI